MTFALFFSLLCGIDTPMPPEQIKTSDIENLFRLTPRLYSGGQPEGEAGLKALKDLGIKTIVTVDGAVPPVEEARRLGIRYVHLPVGYDGIDRERAIQLAQAVETLPGPIYIHCHHGKHRGPTAAAICAMVAENWNRDRALDWLKIAGTSPDYAGLYAVVQDFQPPRPAERAQFKADLPERAKVPALVEAMVAIDERWEHLQKIAEAGFRPPPNHPDLDPPHEALLLAEHYRESRRLDESKARGPDFLAQLKASENQALALQKALQDRPDQPAPLTSAFAKVGQDCKACHNQYRDR